MKIGILTLPFNNNYGGFLQEYALMHTLKKMNHDVWFMDLQYKKSLKKPFISALNNAVKKYILRQHIHSIVPYEDRLDEIKSWQYTRPFVDKYLCPKLSPIHASEELRYLLKQIPFDAFIVGSDQIWRPKYMGNFLGTIYLDFVESESVKRLSYAASFGTDVWEYSPEQTHACEKLIQRFHAVSVREDSGVKLCHDNFDITAQLVLDPTLLLSKDDYIKLIADSRTEACPGDLFCYVLDQTEDKKKVIDGISDILELRTFHMGIHEPVKKPVEQWLRSFHDAKFVITDSFHGMVFSIIFQKPFLVYGNKARGLSRFTSLLKLLGLEDRLIVDSKASVDSDIIYKEINWSMVEERLEENRNISLSFLTENLASS